MVVESINKKVADYFNKRGGNYSLAWASVAKRRLSRLEVEFIRRGIEQARKSSGSRSIKTLDIGVGNGRIIEAVLGYAVEHYGTDISQTMVDYCKEKFKDNKKVKELMVHDILEPLPESWGKFDVVTAIRVLSYTPLWERELHNIYEALTPGGVLVFTFPNKYSSFFISRLVHRKENLGYESNYSELKRVVKDTGFSKFHVEGLNRLLDVFYDWCDNDFSANVLFGIERILRMILGPTLFTREFYVTCKK